MKRKRVKSWLRGGSLSLVWLLLAAIGIIYFVQPALLAMSFPGYFGFEPVGGGVYVEAAMPKELRMRLASAIREGEAKAEDFYGQLEAAPVILACATKPCWQKLGGGGAKGISYANIGIRIALAGIDPVILAHERSHTELHERLGLTNFVLGKMPAWFDEGLAVIVSDDARYLFPKNARDRCRVVESAGDFPVRKTDWTRAAGADHDLYARAACRVLRWMNAAGGKNAALALITKVSEGVPFEALYRDPMDQSPTLANVAEREERKK
ncbi:MAG TPA: hypothetical protein VEK34_14915 [Methylocella sp.]|nr:hypothetical protein [Methylocella sp.]